MRTDMSHTAYALLLGSLVLQPAFLAAQEAEPQPSPPAAELPEIPDQPLTVDPATLVPQKLAAPATIEFDEASLRDIAAWIQQDRSIPVLFDNAALADARVPLGEPVSDRLSNEPLYFLLNACVLWGWGGTCGTTSSRSRPCKSSTSGCRQTVQRR